jgi:hypothetical protein
MSKILNFPGTNKMDTDFTIATPLETVENIISLLEEDKEDTKELIVLSVNHVGDLQIYTGTNVDGPRALWLLEHAKMELLGV